MIGTTVRQAILADAPLLALVSTRVYPLVYPTNATFPCITYRLISGYHEDVVNEQIITSRIQFDVWSYNYETTGNVAGELLRLFHFLGGTINGQEILSAKVDLVFDTFEQNIKAHRKVIDIRIVHKDD